MTITDMRKYLEDRGFIVDTTGAGPNCEFTIRRGPDAHTKILYDACIGTDRNELMLRREKFLDDILAEFNMLHPDNVRGGILNDAFKAYIDTDIAFRRQRLVMPSIKNVIFNNPATIVFWTDGSKTVVKAQDGDIFDPEKGLAMAISKKALGNKGNYCNELKKWLPKEEEPEGVSGEVAAEVIRSAIREAIQNVNKKPRGRFGV